MPSVSSALRMSLRSRSNAGRARTGSTRSQVDEESRVLGEGRERGVEGIEIGARRDPHVDLGNVEAPFVIEPGHVDHRSTTWRTTSAARPPRTSGGRARILRAEHVIEGRQRRQLRSRT